jgi:DNA-binding CsgD family transcriptional regulator
MRLTLEELSHVLALIHEAAASPERWSDAITALTRLGRSSKGAILDFDRASGQVVNVEQVGHDPAAQKEYVEYYYAVDPTLEVTLAAQPHRALASYEHFSTAVRARHEYFNYMARNDVGDVIGTVTRASGKTTTLLSLQRPLRAPAFDGEAKRLFSLVTPHLEVAKRVQARVAEANAVRDSLAAGLDRLADAAFIVDASLTIRHLNAQAQRLLAADARVRGTGGRLSLPGTRLQSAFQAAVRAAGGKAMRSQLLLLPAGGSMAAAEVAVCPLPETHRLASPWQQPLVLVMVSLPRHDLAAIAARMRQLYQLTKAESLVAGQLALGSSVEEIARRSGVRESTVRSQLKSIRAKTGVSRQAELVRLALGGIPLA